MAEKLIINANLVCKADRFVPKKCAVEKVIEVTDTEFRRLIEKPLERSYFLIQYKDLMGYYDNSYHGVLFVNKQSGDGFFVNSEGYDYPRYSQFIPQAKTLVKAHEQTLSLTEIKLYCPLKFLLEPDNDYSDLLEVSPSDYIEFADKINQKIKESFESDEDLRERGLTAFSDNQKIHSAFVCVEERNGELYGAVTVKCYGELSKAELADITDELSGQLSDGWGESFEQHPVRLGDDTFYISFWNSGDDYFLKPESEVFPEQGLNQGMGGLN